MVRGGFPNERGGSDDAPLRFPGRLRGLVQPVLRQQVLRPLLQVLKVVSHNKDDVRVKMNVWCSNNKICLITDFLDMDISKNIRGNHKLTEKFLRMEQLLGDFNGTVKLFKFKSSGVSRVSIEFYPKFSQRLENIA